MSKCRLTLLPSGASRSFPAETPLVEALLDMEAEIKTPCGGKGTCGKCRLTVTGKLSPPTAHEKKIDSPDTRLACQARLQGDVQVYLPERTSDASHAYPVLDPHGKYGVSVDIGTTTVRIALVDHAARTFHDIATFLNPQRRYGHDVISRIAAAANPAVARRQTALIRNTILSAIARASTAMELPASAIERIVFSGNTTMLSLLFGLDVTPLGHAPYAAPCLDFDFLSPDDIGTDRFPHAHIYALPARSAFLGGDLIGGLAVCHAMGLTRGIFFIDLGTNGEIFLSDADGAILATSCAMGPALEGMNISCGMTADTGAITHVQTQDGALQYAMLGDGVPAGITGTALIDLLAIFLARGVITPSGALTRAPLPNPARYHDAPRARRIDLWDGLAVTQQDIRSLQLAKAASLAASRMLLSASGCPLEAVEHVVVAGAIGEHLDLDNFRRLGFIPDFPYADYTYLGNTSLKAAQLCCLNLDFLAQARAMRDRVREVALADSPVFQQIFLDAITFPSTGDA